MHVSKRVYSALNNGDPISDADLVEGMDFFLKLSADLWHLGDVFRLSAQEATRVHRVLCEFQAARARV